ncbi:SAM-dependent methyltransferase [Actinopolymorpha sp. NPDC004070]|uniref:class I SAM-dependent methyltransferase n=1 Tax=Actinopolymorpha sp. NPDC004070 TaxID=3154548 RepID=UPI0033A6F657
MPEPLSQALARVREELLDPERLVRAVAAGRRRGHETPWRRAELRYVDVRAGRVLQITTYDERQAHTRNASPGPEAEEAVDGLLATAFGNWHLDSVDETLQLRVTKKGEAQVHVRPRVDEQPVSREHDREKPRLLPADDPVLRAVGIADHQGRIKPTRQAKYRQVDEFLRVLEPALDRALETGLVPRPTDERPLRVVDLGCGNAYLTFAAASYLANVRKLALRMTGIDLRTQARDRNTKLATELGFGHQLTFAASSIASAELDDAPDLVLSLHACDTATDDALARAVRWEAPLILAAPCCHHDIQVQLSQVETPEPYAIITRHGILRERFADVLTDALRASILRRHGYRVETIQFVGSEHTPRNIMLRATRTGAEAGENIGEEYTDMTKQWNVRPALARLLDG